MEEHERAPMQARSTAALMHRLIDAPYLLLTLAPLFWAGNFVLGRAVAANIPPIGLAFWRWVVSGGLLLSLAISYLRQDCPLIVRHWKILLLLAVPGVAVFNTLVYIGLQSTTAINGLLMQSTMPVWIVALSWVFFRETITFRQSLGFLMSLAGALTIIARGDYNVLLALRLNRGDALILLAVASYAAYSSLLRRRPPIHPLSFLTVTFLAGAAVLLPFYVWEHLGGQTMPLRGSTVLVVGYVAIFASIVATFCYNRGIEIVGANRAGLFIHLMPVFGSLLAVLFLSEAVQWFHGLGMLLILCGIGLATRSRST